MIASLFVSCLLALSAFAAEYPTRVIYQDLSDPSLENIAVRSSGNLLITSVTSSTLYTLDPTATNPSLTNVITLPGANCLTGIVEGQPEVFALISSSMNLTLRRAAPGSVTVWSVDLTSGIPLVRQIAVVANTTILDGVSTVPGSPNLILAADPDVGAVWQINMATGEAQLAVVDVSMAPGAPAPALGINGLHMNDEGMLYYSNSQQTTFLRMPLNLTGASGNTVQPAGDDHEYDDFTFDAQGRIWVATHTGAVTLLTPETDGSFQTEIVAGSLIEPSVFMEPTSAEFGRGSPAQEATLYVTTEDGQLIAVNTTSAEA
ncbi:hypothetical protein FB45DRAFT_754733 [Roridomyces roridus]|uniref:SMP-30/Gluconolactonase/LRE-like region domain-containing protein n=1 Tax=Roridomyces roridus TaxID=1738132 RepID=A0AAD7BGK3_9AGAR|nr:hypothetical protein FB45DRAFT_754733 [Roridomyces roridus]